MTINFRTIFGVSEAERRAHQERVRQRQTRKEACARRAYKLLRQHLTRGQLKTYATKRWFHVCGNHTNHVYRIDCRDVTGNIQDINTGKRYCIVAEEGYPWHDEELPNGDHLLAQKLIIETNEKKFRRIAFRVG